MLSDKRAYKYRIKFFVKKISIAIGFPCKMSVMYKKGKKKMPFLKEPELDIKKFEARFEETIEFESIYFKSMTTGKWIREENVITVVIMTPQKNKTAGVLNIALTDFLDAGKQKSPAEVVKLDRCPDKKARFYFAY
jgi:N-terminal C2 in EEIG1 and EHBP1 proteins